MVTVDNLPPPEERDPHTLYLPENEGKGERDRYLGVYMDRWSGLERMLLLLLSHLIGSYEKAEVAFYSATSIKTHTDMITGLMVLERPQQSSKWRKLCDKCLKASTVRNHLVHGQWRPEYRVGVDDKNRPTVTQLE